VWLPEQTATSVGRISPPVSRCTAGWAAPTALDSMIRRTTPVPCSHGSSAKTVRCISRPRSDSRSRAFPFCFAWVTAMKYGASEAGWPDSWEDAREPWSENAMCRIVPGDDHGRDRAEYRVQAGSQLDLSARSGGQAESLERQ